MGMSFSDLQKIAKDAGFSTLPAGDYEAQITKAEAKKASTGKDMISVMFKVIPTEINPTKGTVFNNFVISPDSPNAVAFFFRHMEALGLAKGYFEANPTMEDVAEQLVGRKARITVGVRQYNGQDRNEVTSVKPSQINDVMAPPPASAPASDPMKAPASDPMATASNGASANPSSVSGDPFS